MSDYERGGDFARGAMNAYLMRMGCLAIPIGIIVFGIIGWQLWNYREYEPPPIEAKNKPSMQVPPHEGKPPEPRKK